MYAHVYISARFERSQSRAKVLVGAQKAERGRWPRATASIGLDRLSVDLSQSVNRQSPAPELGADLVSPYTSSMLRSASEPQPALALSVSLSLPLRFSPLSHFLYGRHIFTSERGSDGRERERTATVNHFSPFDRPIRS